MEFFIIVSCITTFICALSIIREPRRFLNCVLVLFSLGMWLLTVTQYGYENSTPNVVIGILFLMIPFIYMGIMIYLMVNGIKVIKKEGFSIANSLSFVLSMVMMFFPVILIAAIMLNDFFSRVDIMFCVFTLIFYFMVTFGGFFMYSVIYCMFPRNTKCDYIIIHGAGLTEDGKLTPLLKRRVDKAIKIYRRSNGSSKLVPSGGQGADEKVSEAEAMTQYLITQGINSEDIILEDKSTTTFENLEFVKKILDTREKGRKYRCIFVTNNYHVLRTSFYARKLRLRAQGVGCRTAGYYLPSAFIREYVAVMKMNVVFNVVLILFIILEIIML